jgi:hypothetical protein
VEQEYQVHLVQHNPVIHQVRHQHPVDVLAADVKIIVVVDVGKAVEMDVKDVRV